MTLRQYGVQTTIYFPLIDKDATDFESTPVTHASGDSQISKDGGAFANTTNSFAHEGNGIYSLVLTATEMEAKEVVVTIIDQGTKAWEDQAVIITTCNHASAEIDALDANTIEISGDSTAADNAEADYDGTGYAKTNSTIGTATDVTNEVSADVTKISGDATAADNCEAFFDDTGFNASNSEIGTVATATSVTALAASERNEIADALLKRDVDQVEATAPVHSLTGAILKLVSKFTASTGVTKRTDGTTTFMTQTPTTDAGADPVTELGVAS